MAITIGNLTQIYLQTQQAQRETADIASGTTTAPQEAQDKATLSPQARMKTGAAFGESMPDLTPEQRAHIGGIHARVKSEAAAAEKEGRPYDATAQFPLEVMKYADAGLHANTGDKALATTFNNGRQFLEAYGNLNKSQQQK